MELKQMNKSQLLETMKKHGISVPEGSNIEKGPTNAELVVAIKVFNDAKVGEVEEAPKPKSAGSVKKFKKEDQMRADVLRKERVMVIDTQRFQSLDEDAPISFPASFSNGIVEDAMLVSLSGDPQFISRGLIQTLESVELEEWTQEGNTAASIRKHHRKRFVVTPVGGMTDDEIEAQKKRELARVGA